MKQEYSFYNDYSEGAHPRILKALTTSNLTQETGYGQDAHSLKAADLIRRKINNPQAAVHFVSGGTQTNLIVLAAMLGKPYEAVIGAQSAHINVHEAGAIEATGHKILTVDSKDGKVKPDQVQNIVDTHTDEHMVKPKVVFISDATELGTVYAKHELEELSRVCKDNKLYLYLDGARLGSALVAKDTDITLPELSNLVDAFYIGGTKNGALLGEAIVINNPNIQEDFRYHLKQRGALLAKGRVLGIQFEELFRDDLSSGQACLYFDLARHANEMASQLTEGIKSAGYEFLVESPTNQIFPILPNSVIERLSDQYGFYVWSQVDNNSSAIRLVTSWATTQVTISKFLADLKTI